MIDQSNINKEPISQSKCQLNFAFNHQQSPKSLLRILNVWMDFKDFLRDPYIVQNPNDFTIAATQSVLYFSSSKFLTKMIDDCIIPIMPDLLQSLIHKFDENKTHIIGYFLFAAYKFDIGEAFALTTIYALSQESYQYKRHVLVKKNYHFAIYEDHLDALKRAFLEFIMNPFFLINSYFGPFGKESIAKRLVFILERYASYFFLSHSNHLLDQISEEQKESLTLLNHFQILGIQVIGKNISSLVFMSFFGDIYKPNIEKMVLLTWIDFCNYYYSSIIDIKHADKKDHYYGLGYFTSLMVLSMYLYISSNESSDKQSITNKITTFIYGITYSAISYQIGQVILSYVDAMNFDEYFNLSREFDSKKVLKYIQGITRSDGIEEARYTTVALDLKEPHDDSNMLLLATMPENY